MGYFYAHNISLNPAINYNCDLIQTSKQKISQAMFWLFLSYHNPCMDGWNRLPTYLEQENFLHTPTTAYRGNWAFYLSGSRSGDILLAFLNLKNMAKILNNNSLIVYGRHHYLHVRPNVPLKYLTEAVEIINDFLLLVARHYVLNHIIRPSLYCNKLIKLH